MNRVTAGTKELKGITQPRGLSAYMKYRAAGRAMMNGTMPTLRVPLVVLCLIASLDTIAVHANGTTFTITSNTNWSAISGGPPTSADAVIIKNGATLTVDVSNAVCASVTLGVSGGASNGNGTLAFNSSSQLTVSGTVTLGDASKIGTITMTSGGTLICRGFVDGGGAVLTPGSGTIQLTATNTLIADLTTYNNLEINGTGTTTTLGVATTINGNLSVSSGTLDLSTFTANRASSGGTLTLSDGATLKIGGTNTLPPNYATHSFGSTSTVEYSGTNQTVSNESYRNLTLSGSGTKTMPSSAMTIAGNFTLGGTASATASANITVEGNFTVASGATFDAGSAVLRVRGNWNGSGTFIPSFSTIVMDGSSAQTKTGSTSYNLTIENPAGVTLSTSQTVNGTLALTNGKVTLGSNSLTIGSSSSISGGSSSSYIVTNGTGVLTRNGVGASNVAFPVGTSSTYNPVTINNSGTADDFSVRVQSSFDNAPNDGSKVVNCQWTITEVTSGGSNATITLQWNTADEAGSFVRTNPIYIGRHTGTQWVQTAATFTDLGGGVYTASASGFTSFSPFGVGNSNALPIQLASFGANVIRDNDVEVLWKTVSETNNYGFEIYRKRGESDEWKKIAFVEGHGTTLTPQSYSYVDKALTFGKYSYRIKQIDLDGKTESFPEMEVNVGANPDRFVLAQNYPNPFNPSTIIEFAVPQTGFATMQVYNLLGQEVATLFEGNAEAGKIYTVRFSATGRRLDSSSGSAFRGNPSNLPSGMYFYTLRSAGKVETRRMLLMK